MLMDKKCDQSGMRNYVEGQINRNPKTASSILFAMMDQYVDEDTDVEKEVVANGLDEEYVDEDGSDIEAQVNWNIANEHEPEFSRDIDAEDFLSGEADCDRVKISRSDGYRPLKLSSGCDCIIEEDGESSQHDHSRE
jgi:hypothetical protein